MNQNVFTKEQLTLAYQVFQEVSGGLYSGWIFSEETMGDNRRYMIGTPESGAGEGRTWSCVWINLETLTEVQIQRWLELKDSIPGLTATDYTNSNNLVRLQFTPHADKLQTVSPKMESDPPADTEAGG